MIDGGSNWILGKSTLLTSSKGIFISDTSTAMYCQTLKVASSVRPHGVITDNHSNMKLKVEQIERVCLMSRMNITRLNSTNATLLICLYETFVRPYMDYACTALATLIKSQRHRLEAILKPMQKWQLILPVFLTIKFFLIISTCCNTVRVEHYILPVAKNWWGKPSNNYDEIVSFTYHH